MALDVALDIGTARTRLATSSRGVIFDEPTVVAIDTTSGDVVEVGHDALEVVGRSSRHVVAFRPLWQGATIDFDVTARLISGLFDRAGVSKLSRARVVMSVPTLATAIEQRAIRQAAIQAGAKEVSLIEAPIAAAIGLAAPSPYWGPGPPRLPSSHSAASSPVRRGVWAATISTRRLRPCCAWS
jgi:rod shape-determining protein MreB and related proteins